jgi:hypothetical protein
LTELAAASPLHAHHGREQRSAAICFPMLRHHIEKLELQPALFAEIPALMSLSNRRPRHRSHAAAPPNCRKH